MTQQQTIAATLERLHAGNVVEVRALEVPPNSKPDARRDTWSGYFDDYEAAAEAAVQLDQMGAEGVYVQLNDLHPGCLCRSPNRLTRNPRHTTSDRDIIKRRWVLIDVDPVRPAGISSTNAELFAAVACAASIAGLPEFTGFDRVSAVSGNGAHLLIGPNVFGCSPVEALHLLAQIDSSNDATTIKRGLEVLSRIYSDERIEVDTATYNAARITRLYGTAARKGHPYGDRPHRLSYLIEE